MATRQSVEVARGDQPRSLRVGTVSKSAVYSAGAALSLSAGDVIQMIPVSKGSRLVYLGVSGGSGDALVAVGDGVDDDRYIAYGTASSASPVVRTISTHAAMVPYVYSTDDTIDIAVSTVSVGTITGGFHMTAIFSMD